jgi:L-fucose mutarotase
MEVVGQPGIRAPIFARVQAAVDRAEGRAIPITAVERFAFYEAARRSFAIIRTADSGPYGCFILKKGVIDLPPL